MRSKTQIVFLNLLILIPVFFLTGCGLTGNLLDWKGDGEIEEYASGRQAVLIKIEKYIGKSKDEVREDLGDPTEVDRPDYSAQFNGIQFEERWAYIYRRGIPLIYSEGCVKFFYFNEGKVVAVDVL
jgi:hypothetical protein